MSIWMKQKQNLRKYEKTEKRKIRKYKKRK